MNMKLATAINRYPQRYVNKKEYIVLLHKPHIKVLKYIKNTYKYNNVGRDSSVSIAIHYGLNGSGIESW
jgi:hypothetical protein